MRIPPSANPAGKPALRLVTDSRGSAATPSILLDRRAAAGSRAEVSDARARAIAAENRAASSLSATDARWVFAAFVDREIEGGNAAILRPERRRRLLAAAGAIGLRPFDANLIIAIVQDARRAGEPAARIGMHERLALVRPPSPREASRGSAFLAASATILLAAALAGWLISLIRA